MMVGPLETSWNGLHNFWWTLQVILSRRAAIWYLALMLVGAGRLRLIPNAWSALFDFTCVELDEDESSRPDCCATRQNHCLCPVEVV